MKLPAALLTRFSCLLFFLLLIISPAAKAEVTHTVKPGETFYRIAKKYHVTTSQLQEANKLSSDRICVGKSLVIPQQRTKASTSEKGKKGAKLASQECEAQDHQIPESHTVKKGETLTGIAHRYNLKVGYLREINQLQGKKLKAGQILRLTRGDGDQEELEADSKEAGGEPIPGQAEAPKGRVKGSGFFIDEKDRQLLVRVAKSFLGLNYSRGGTSVNGMDCSAFVQKVFRVFDIDLPRTAREQFQVGYAVAREALRMGDLVFFKRSKARAPTHVGIYIGNNQFIHTSLRKRRVEIGNLESRYFALQYVGAKRIEEARKGGETEESMSDPNWLSRG